MDYRRAIGTSDATCVLCGQGIHNAHTAFVSRCGHGWCLSCQRNTQRRHCPVCRATVVRVPPHLTLSSTANASIPMTLKRAELQPHFEAYCRAFALMRRVDRLARVLHMQNRRSFNL